MDRFADTGKVNLTDLVGALELGARDGRAGRRIDDGALEATGATRNPTELTCPPPRTALCRRNDDGALEAADRNIDRSPTGSVSRYCISGVDDGVLEEAALGRQPRPTVPSPFGTCYCLNLGG